MVGKCVSCDPLFFISYSSVSSVCVGRLKGCEVDPNILFLFPGFDQGLSSLSLHKYMDHMVYLTRISLVEKFVKWSSVNRKMLKIIDFIIIFIVVGLCIFMDDIAQGGSALSYNG